MELGSTWEEKARPGHTVVIVKLTTNKWSNQPEVEYRHVGVHNVRAQRHSTLSEVRRFKKRFVEVANA